MATEKILIFDEQGNAKRMKVRIARFLDNEPVTSSDKENIRETLGVDDSLSGTFTTALSVTSANDSTFTGGGDVGIGAAPGSTRLRVSGGSGQLFKIDDGGNALVTVDATGATTMGAGAALTIDTSGNLILQKGGGAYVQLKDGTAVRGSINVGTSDGLTFTTGASFSTAMQIDSAGNVAIGHGAFGAKLDIATAANTNGIFLRDVSDSSITHNLYIDSSGNGNLAIYADGQVAKANINSAGDSYFNGGNVGFMTASPDAGVHLKKALGETIIKAEVGGNSTVGFEIKKTGSTTQGWRIVDGQTVNGKLEFYDVTNSATRATIDSSGRLGLGTVSPARPLHVVGNGTLAQFESTGNTPYVSLKDSGGTHTYLGNAAGDFVIQTADGGYSSKLVVYNGGNVAVPQGNLVLSSGGIDFGSVAGGTGTPAADGGLLNDFERGSFTPSFTSTGTAPTLTYLAQVGTYTKVGNLVTCHGRVRVNAVTGAGTGSLQISGLPFATQNVSNLGSGGSVCLAAFFGTSSSGCPTHISGGNNATVMTLKTLKNSAGVVASLDNTDAADLANSCYVDFSITYTTA